MNQQCDLAQVERTDRRTPEHESLEGLRYDPWIRTNRTPTPDNSPARLAVIRQPECQPFELTNRPMGRSHTDLHPPPVPPSRRELMKVHLKRCMATADRSRIWAPAPSLNSNDACRTVWNVNVARQALPVISLGRTFRRRSPPTTTILSQLSSLPRPRIPQPAAISSSTILRAWRPRSCSTTSATSTLRCRRAAFLSFRTTVFSLAVSHHSPLDDTPAARSSPPVDSSRKMRPRKPCKMSGVPFNTIVSRTLGDQDSDERPLAEMID